MYNKVILDITAPDMGTEIFVVASDLQLVHGGKGVGRLDLEVDPGLYKVRFRSASEIVDELVEVDGTSRTHPVIGRPLRFRSAVPLEETSTTHEYHQEHAHRLSLELHKRHGSLGGAQLFLFLRNEDTTLPGLEPEVLTIHDAQGTRLFSLAEGNSDPVLGYAGLNVEVDPGTYRVRVDGRLAGTYEYFLTTCAGYQTQVFLFVADFPDANGDLVRSPSMERSSIMMKPVGTGFDSEDKASRMTELACIGLAQGRRAISDEEVERLAQGGEVADPLFILYVAHLLCMEDRSCRSTKNEGVIDRLCERVDALLGPHPDLLALRARKVDPVHLKGLAFPFPPMLRQSWDLVTSASYARSSIVPPRSIAAIVSPNLVSSSPWLLFRVEKDEPAPAQRSSVPRAMDQLAQMLGSEAPAMENLMELNRSGKLPLNQLETSILSGITRQNRFRSWLEEEAEDLKPQKKVRGSPSSGFGFAQWMAPASATAASIEKLFAHMGALDSSSAPDKEHPLSDH